MTLSPLVIGIIVVTVLALLGLAAVLLLMSARRRSTTIETPSLRSAEMIAEARLEGGERESSPVSEQIEEMARRRLAQYPDLADVHFDFGTMPDGTIDIWVGEQQYDDPEDIPDERIRQAIQEAVAEFNARQ